MAVAEIRDRLRKQKQGRAIYLGDATKAFDIMRRKPAFRAIRKKLKNRPLTTRLLASLREVYSVTYAKHGEPKQYIRVRLHEGVPQGGPNGPALFVIGNEGFADRVEENHATTPVPPQLRPFRTQSDDSTRKWM